MLKKIIVFIITFFLICICIIGLRFGSALFQEENTLEILTSIGKLHTTNEKYVQINEGLKEIKFVSKNEAGNQEEVITEYMLTSGWDFKEQMGSAYVFEKEKETIVVETRLFSKHYFLWDVPKEFLQ